MNNRLIDAVVLAFLGMLMLSGCGKSDSDAPRAVPGVGFGTGVAYTPPPKEQILEKVRAEQKEMARKERSEFLLPTTDDGFHPLGDSKFMIAYAVKNHPELLNNEVFVNTIAQAILGVREFNEFRSNEFDWPQKKEEALKALSELISKASDVNGVFVDLSVPLGSYDVASNAFPIDYSTSAFRKGISSISLPKIEVPLLNNTSFYLKTALKIPSPIDLDQVPVDEAVARRFVDSLKGGYRSACLRVVYSLSSVELEPSDKNDFTNPNGVIGIYFHGTPTKYELRDTQCQEKLGESGA